MAADMTDTPMAELPIAGYLDRLSCRPGESLAVKVSVRAPVPAARRWSD